MAMINVPPNLMLHKELIENAFAKWAPGASVTLTDMPGGRSGSSLSIADVRGSTGPIVHSGKYILKISPQPTWEDHENEVTAYRRAYGWNTDFSKDHIPALIEAYPSDPTNLSAGGYAILYEVAGRSLDQFSTTSAPQDGTFQIISEKILKSILLSWASSEFESDAQPSKVLRDLCGYRLDKSAAPELHQFCKDKFDDRQIFIVSDEVLINPLRFVQILEENSLPASPVLEGLNHCDLHGGNILAHRMLPFENPFWIIDFALSRKGPIGYDAAYLELSHALTAIGDLDSTLLVGALRAAEDIHDRNPLPGDAFWTKNIITKLRGTLTAWRDDVHPYRSDEIDRQLALCRVAAGINWANKRVKDSWRFAALCYAGWAARQYLKTHQPETWKKIGSSNDRNDSPVSLSKADKELWKELWEATKGFDPAKGKFILVAGVLDSKLPIRALGQLPWSAIIDLDPASETSGLHRQVEPLLAAHRAVRAFDSQIPTFDLRRGTAWMMASGWAAKSEYFPDYNVWRWERVPIIRDFVRRLAETTNPEPLHAIILPGATLDLAAPMARLNSVIGILDEATQGRAFIHLLGNQKVSESVKRLSPLPLEPAQFMAFVADTFGTSFSAQIAEIPGPDGTTRTIPLGTLRPMQENLYILHSTVMEDQSSRNDTEGEFWRGRRITWAELHSGMDIERDIHQELLQILSEKLDVHRTQTVVLDHSPGAGGTTAALRAAWDLKSRYPVAILHTYSETLPHRVRELFHLAERTVLLVAESSDLTDAAREELYRYLAENNCRVVLLYIRRTLKGSDTSSNLLVDRMKNQEASSFLELYSNLNPDRTRNEQLKQITHREDRERYRIPFFYGLITFEREFLGIDSYVESHLQQVRKAARDMLEYLALVTIYSSNGISSPLLNVMMGFDPNSTLFPEELLGTGPARLLISRNGNFRFMHQIIAEKVLSNFHGSGPLDDWRLDLKTYAIDFIRDAVSAAGPEALRPLFREIFLERVGGTSGVDDREEFAPIIETLDAIDKTLGHAVLEKLAEECPQESHFWSHLGRHQVYRLRRDYDKAEEYLLRAINISPSDPLHHHTFGLVLRSRLRHKLTILPKGLPVEKVFEEFDPMFARAAFEFEETRRLSPDNVYGYMTHIQMVCGAALRLKEAAHADTIASIGAQHPQIQSWLQENLALAEQLLRDAAHLYGTFDQSNEYLIQAKADLNRLYGNLDKVVQLWEVVEASGRAGAVGRRALANAYLARNDRTWRGLDTAELRRVVALMEINIREAGRKDDDYQLWFNALIMLPEFSADTAMGQLALWSKRFSSWRAHYYLYVLNFLLWYTRRTDDLDEFHQALDECIRRHVGRKNASSLWLGAFVRGAGLVPEGDLGGWRKELDFFSKTDSLRRVNGKIETIKGPQAGTILIDGRVRAFFVPGKTFSSHRDENVSVNFYLGFSPSGLRAWSVAAGPLHGGDRAPYIVAAAGSEGVVVAVSPLEEDKKMARAKTLSWERVMNFALDLVVAKAKIDATLTVAEMEERLDAAFGIGGIAAHFGVEDLELTLSQTGKFYIHSVGSERVIEPMKETSGSEADDSASYAERVFGQVDRYNQPKNYGFIRGQDDKSYWFHRKSILNSGREGATRKGDIVAFIAGVNEKGGVANGITLLPDTVLSPNGLLPPQKLTAAISKFVIDQLNGGNQQGIDLYDLLAALKAAFRLDMSLEHMLRDENLTDVITSIEGVEIGGRPPQRIVRLSRALAFGRLAPSRGRSRNALRSAPPSAPSHDKASSTVHDISTLREIVLSMVRQASAQGEPIYLSAIGQDLRLASPEYKTILLQHNYFSLTALLHDMDEIDELNFDRPGVAVVRLVTSDPEIE